MTQRKHRVGVPCPQCNNQLTGLFAYCGDNSTIDKVIGYNYCKTCNLIYKVVAEVVK